MFWGVDRINDTTVHCGHTILYQAKIDITQSVAPEYYVDMPSLRVIPSVKELTTTCHI